MASAVTSTFAALNPEEVNSFAEVINELTWADPTLTALHDVEQGIKHDKQIVFAGRMGLMGKALTGCTPNEIDGITLTEKFWRPVYEDFRLKHCSADVNVQNKIINQMAKMNPDYYDVIQGTNSPVGKFLIASVIDGFKESILRKAWFSDTAAATIAGAGVFTNGTDVGYFNTFDGLFKQIFTEVTGDNYVAIPKNAGASYVDQKLAAGEAIAVLSDMYDAADSRLLSLPGAKFYVTRTIYDNYLKDLESIQNTGAGNTVINEKGQLSLTYRGIEVVNIEIWDRTIKDYENSGTAYNLPHRAVLTAPMNIPVGTLAEGDFGKVEAFYDQYNKVNVIDGVYTIDAKHLQSYLTVAAY